MVELSKWKYFSLKCQNVIYIDAISDIVNITFKNIFACKTKKIYYGTLSMYHSTFKGTMIPLNVP